MENDKLLRHTAAWPNFKGKFYAEGKKPGIKEDILCDSSYLKF